MNLEKVNEVKNILENIGNRIATISFIKKDGSVRNMQLHKSQELIEQIKNSDPQRTASRKWTLSQNGMMCVQELTCDHKHQWRTVNLDTVTRIACDGNVRTFA